MPGQSRPNNCSIEVTNLQLPNPNWPIQCPIPTTLHKTHFPKTLNRAKISMELRESVQDGIKDSLPWCKALTIILMLAPIP